MKQTKKTHPSRHKTWVLMSLALFLIVSVLVTLFFIKVLAPYLHSAAELRLFLEGYGWRGHFILLGLQCLQVIVALIPGEIIELGAGYAYGAIVGTLICLIGVSLSSSLIFILVKKIGTPMVELFIPREKIQQLRFINSSAKLKRLVFLMFLIPGTPKDTLTYFVGLTDMTLPQFLVITLLARIPSILSSTISGQMLGDQHFVVAGVVYAVTGILSALGYWCYSSLLKRHER